ncbi:integrase [Amycolatopsis sp. lyj-108]|uniref:integrase n=1 Tax=Amycolatopsis sp. lyj-108 TaxID=2789286 RepID=UPI00397D2BA7
MTENPSQGKATIYWERCPFAFRDQLRLVAWHLINAELGPAFRMERGRLRGRLSVAVTSSTVDHWMHLALWLEARGIRSLSECDTAVLHDYGTHVRGQDHSRGYTRKTLMALTRLWAFDQLSASPIGVARPPWEDMGVDDYLPAVTTAGGENETEPLSERTMGPLLIWAMRMVDHFAEDVLAAAAERQRLLDVAANVTTSPAGQFALRAFLDPLIDAQKPVPTTRSFGRRALARTYISGMTGATFGQIDRFVQRAGLLVIAAERPGPCPLDVQVTARLAGQAWRTAIDYDEVATLMRHLGTAAFIVCSYLTGMRPGEVLGLRAGCCPTPEPAADGTASRHLIRSHEYKGATDEQGNHHSAGVERDVPWVAIAPVVRAIRVLERMVPAGGLLFDHRAHDLHARPGTGSLKLNAFRKRIDAFVQWANQEAAVHGLTGKSIPPDPLGLIGTARFRRSLAWHIARRPNGLVALAIQYGHLRTAISGEYASRGRGGIHELIDIETVRAVADTVADVHDDLMAGRGVSGPAARRAIKAAATAPRFAGTVITAITARRLLVNEDSMIYDNPHALLLCHYKRATALCHRDGVKDTPSLDHCVPGCANIVRTDRHAAQLRERANTLNDHATHVLQPIGDRLRANAERLRGYAETHDRSRTTLTETTR